MAKNSDKAPEKSAAPAAKTEAPGVYLVKDSGDYKAGAEITVDPAASLDPKSKGPVRVHPARMEAWLRDGIAARRGGDPAVAPRSHPPTPSTAGPESDPPAAASVTARAEKDEAEVIWDDDPADRETPENL